MTIWSRDSTKETGWGHYEQSEPTYHEILLFPANMYHFTLTLNFPTKKLKPIHSSLLDLLLSEIIADIDICISGLEYRDNSIKSSRTLNLWVTLFSSQSATIYGLSIIIPKPYVGKTKFSTIDHTCVLWLGTKNTGHTLNIT